MYNQSYLFRFSGYFQKIARDFSDDVYQAFVAFAIANFFYLTGFLISSAFGNITLAINIDLTFYLLFEIYTVALLNFSLTIYLALGWIIAGIYIRMKFPSAGAKPIIYGAAIIPIYMILFVIYLVLTIMLSAPSVFFGILSAFIVFLGSALFVGGIAYVYLLAIALPGVLVLSLTKNRTKRTYSNVSMSSSFLHSFTMVNPATARDCPFKDKELHGCSYLGYSAPPGILICDHPDTFRKCELYAHLYDKRLEVIDFLEPDENS